jgi:hypothetical protein
MNPKLRSAIAATGVGIFLVASVPATAQAVDNYPPGSKAVSCKVSTNANRSVLKVNMGPNQPGNRFYTFQIERKKNRVWSAYRGVYKTKGSKELRTVNVPKGTYRVQCFGSFGFADKTSKTIKIAK